MISIENDLLFLCIDYNINYYPLLCMSLANFLSIQPFIIFCNPHFVVHYQAERERKEREEADKREKLRLEALKREQDELMRKQKEEQVSTFYNILLYFSIINNKIMFFFFFFLPSHCRMPR